jgi:hypothetical protein
MAQASVPLLKVNPIMLARSLRFGAPKSSSPRASTLPERVLGLKPLIGEVVAQSVLCGGNLGDRHPRTTNGVKLGGPGRGTWWRHAEFELASNDQAKGT